MAILSNLGRLDQTIYVPWPDEKSRLAIINIVLEKYPVAKDVDRTCLAKRSAYYTGGDIVQICRRACMVAIQDSIENKQKIEYSDTHNDVNATDSTDEIRREHFENVMYFGGCIPPIDPMIRRYEQFIDMWILHHNFKSLFRTFTFPQNIIEHSDVKQASSRYTDDDDLYG